MAMFRTEIVSIDNLLTYCNCFKVSTCILVYNFFANRRH